MDLQHRHVALWLQENVEVGMWPMPARGVAFARFLDSKNMLLGKSEFSLPCRVNAGSASSIYMPSSAFQCIQLSFVAGAAIIMVVELVFELSPVQCPFR